METLLGRRRYLTQINSRDDKERARAERQAANTVCQGSAADLLKLAATNIAARYTLSMWVLTVADMDAIFDDTEEWAEWKIHAGKGYSLCWLCCGFLDLR